MSQSEWIGTTRFIEQCLEILEEEHPMTIRQLFYRMLSAGHIENTQPEYAKVSRVMTIARRDGRCEHEWIVDRSRPEYEVSVWENAADYFETIKYCYRRDCWQDQSCHVEVWTEKDAIIGSIEPVTRELGVKIRVLRGFSSTTRVNDIAEEFKRLGGKGIHVFYLGDHDPSGRDIERDVYERVSELGGDFTMRRLAIEREDIRRFNLPPLRIKSSDSRARSFARAHGQQCVELDALPPTELRRRVDSRIRSLIERESWERHQRAEAAERKSIIDYAEKLKNLTRGG